ncbi:MAG: hypothetical protein HQ512_01375 [Rhodospirillales bacterium]|nr:hypothetical protein [Rhodospirillales bacterium]
MATFEPSNSGVRGSDAKETVGNAKPKARTTAKTAFKILGDLLFSKDIFLHQKTLSSCDLAPWFVAEHKLPAKALIPKPEDDYINR